MPTSLLNNLTSLSAQSSLAASSANLNRTVQRLSSGLRINSSGDDAAGLAIANKYRSDIAVLNQGIRNANDGQSTLQIIDGGLNTISNLLDRAATLASQSASDTFNGNRDTLQQEFSNVLSEITRQAQNIGLVQNGVNNKTLTTIIGGGSDAFALAGTNNGIQIDLSGAANRVDAVSLGLSNLNIASLGKVTASGGVDFRDTSKTLTAAETLTFKTLQSDGTFGTAFTVTIAAGATTTAALNTLNSDTNLKAAGITASVNAQTGALELKGSALFTVSSDTAASSVQTGISTAANDIQFSSNANNVSLTATASSSTRAQTFTFNVNGQTIDLTISNTTNQTAAQNAAALKTAINNNQKLRDAGIVAVDTNTTATDTIRIISAKSNFTYSIGAASGSGSGNLFGAATTAAQSATAATTTGSAGAKDALDALKTAISNLGKVQGTVGSGQNRLTQAIDLATSQVINLQAAESRIRDADVTSEASNLSRLSVLQQAGVAALAQANQASQAVLSLLR
jgi:flagellin